MINILDQILSYCDYSTLLTFRFVSKAARKKIDDRLLRHVVARQNAKNFWCLAPPASDADLHRSIRILPQAMKQVYALDLTGGGVHPTFLTAFSSVHTVRRWSGTQSVETACPPTIPMLVDYVDFSFGIPKQALVLLKGVKRSIVHIKFPHNLASFPPPAVLFHGSAPKDIVHVFWPCGPSAPPNGAAGWRVRTRFLTQIIEAGAAQHFEGGQYTIVGVEKIHPSVLRPEGGFASTEEMFDHFRRTVQAIFRTTFWDDDLVKDMMKRTRLVTHKQWATEMRNVIGTEWEEDKLFKDGGKESPG